MNIHFQILVSEKSAKLTEIYQEQKQEFTLQGVGITRLSTLGVCRYLDNVDEVLVHVFFVFKETIISKLKT